MISAVQIYPENRVSQPQDSWQDAENSIDHVEWYTEHVERQTQSVEFVYVRHAVNDYAARLVQVVVELWWFQFVQLDQVLVVLPKKWINIILYSFRIKKIFLGKGKKPSLSNF